VEKGSRGNSSSWLQLGNPDLRKRYFWMKIFLRGHVLSLSITVLSSSSSSPSSS
jgi:hypothetical protein